MKTGEYVTMNACFLIEGNRMIIPKHIKAASKVIGYFSHTHSGQVFCDGDACMIAGSSERMAAYLAEMNTDDNEQDIIKKTRFGEIIAGLRQGGAYAFDEEAYERFFQHAKSNNMSCVSAKEFFSGPYVAMHFIRIQMTD